MHTADAERYGLHRLGWEFAVPCVTGGRSRVRFCRVVAAPPLALLIPLPLQALRRGDRPLPRRISSIYSCSTEGRRLRRAPTTNNTRSQGRSWTACSFSCSRQDSRPGAPPQAHFRMLHCLTAALPSRHIVGTNDHRSWTRACRRSSRGDLLSAKHRCSVYGWMPHNAGFGFLDIPSAALGQIHFLDRF
jgi:hypothetical protein